MSRCDREARSFLAQRRLVEEALRDLHRLREITEGMHYGIVTRVQKIIDAVTAIDAISVAEEGRGQGER